MLLREFTQEEGIVDAAVQFHKELNPKLWESNVLKPKVRYKLLQIAKHFINFIDIPEIRLKDITISGSNAAYSYTPQSDIDLHLVVNVPPDNAMLLKPLYDAKKNQYNYIHDIKIKGIDVELYVQDEEQDHHSLGIYSVLNNKWVEEPTMGTIKISDSDVKDKVENYLNKIMQALTDEDINNVLEVQQEIKRLRKAGLEQGGEFSVENVAFKVLRAKGFIEKLRQHIVTLQDKLLSLETLKMKRNEIMGEHKKGRRAMIYNKKPKTVAEPPKPRNPVAKNAGAAIGGGAAGAHKDAKKASTAVRGQKHKAQPELAEMDSQGYTGSRDDYKLGGPEGTGKAVKAKEFAKKALDILNKQGNDEEWYDRSGNVDPKGAYDAGGHYYMDRDLEEISLGDYRTKANKDRALSGMSAAFGRSPEERAMYKARAEKRNRGLERVKARDEKARKAEQEKQTANLIARLPELEAEYEAMQAKYKSLGGSDWQYADREQNLTDREREARSMEGPMNNLWRQIQHAKKAQGGVSEDAPVAGKVSQVTAKDVTIDDPTQGIKITAPISRLVKGADGKLTLAKPAASTATGAMGSQGQEQDKIQAGEPVSIQPDATEDVHAVSASSSHHGDEENSVNTKSTISEKDELDSMLTVAGLR